MIPRVLTSRLRYIALSFSIFGFHLYGKSHEHITSESLRVKLTQSHLLFHEGNVGEAISLMNEIIDLYLEEYETLLKEIESQFAEQKTVGDEDQKLYGSASASPSTSKATMLNATQSRARQEERLTFLLKHENNENRSAVVECLFARATYHSFRFEMGAAFNNFRIAKQFVMEQQEAITAHLQQHPEDRDSLRDWNNYWKSWRHLVDGSILLIMPGRALDAEKQFRLAISSASNSSISRKIASAYGRMGILDLCEEYLSKATALESFSGHNFNRHISAKDINENNYRLIEEQHYLAQELELQALIAFSSGSIEESLFKTQASLDTIERSTFGVLLKSRCLFAQGETLKGEQLIDEYSESLHDIESQARMLTYKYLVGKIDTDYNKVRRLFEERFGSHFKPKIEALDQEFDKCNNTVAMIDPESGLPIYPPILEILVRRSQYKLLLMDVVGYMEDQARTKQVVVQIEAAGRINKDTL